MSRRPLGDLVVVEVLDALSGIAEEFGVAEGLDTEAVPKIAEAFEFVVEECSIADVLGAVSGTMDGSGIDEGLGSVAVLEITEILGFAVEELDLADVLGTVSWTGGEGLPAVSGAGSDLGLPDTAWYLFDTGVCLRRP